MGLSTALFFGILTNLKSGSASKHWVSAVTLQLSGAMAILLFFSNILCMLFMWHKKVETGLNLPSVFDFLFVFILSGGVLMAMTIIALAYLTAYRKMSEIGPPPPL
jgi:hypothetical protein